MKLLKYITDQPTKCFFFKFHKFEILNTSSRGGLERLVVTQIKVEWAGRSVDRILLEEFIPAIFMFYVCMYIFRTRKCETLFTMSNIK